MGLLFGSAGAHTYLKSGQVVPPPSTFCFTCKHRISLVSHISHKDRKHMVGNVYFKMYRYGLLSLCMFQILGGVGVGGQGWG